MKLIYNINCVFRVSIFPKTGPNKAKAISAKLLELNLKNKLDEQGEKLEETGRNTKKRRN